MADLVGERFGLLVVKALVAKSKRGGYIWLCQCDCGNKTNAITQYLRSGNVKSCGCLRRNKQMVAAQKEITSELSSNKIREPGFYWARLSKFSEWAVYQWGITWPSETKPCWFSQFVSDVETWEDSRFIEIDERRIVRE